MRNDLKRINESSRSLPFSSLRHEHDLLIAVRTILIMVAAGILLIPLPAGYTGLSLGLFTVLSFASVYNERDLLDESRVRGDGVSRRAHRLAVAAMIIVFALMTAEGVIIGMRIDQAQDGVNAASAALKSAGMTGLIVK